MGIASIGITGGILTEEAGRNYRAEIARLKEKARRGENPKYSNVPGLASFGQSDSKISKVATDTRQQIYDQYAKMAQKKARRDAIPRLRQYEHIFSKASQMYGVDKDLLYGIAIIESNGYRKAKSTADAMGLMQVMPEHKRRLKPRKLFAVEELDLYDPWHNIFTGTDIFVNYTERRSGDPLLGLVAYNWGPNHSAIKNASSYEAAKSEIKSAGPRIYPINVIAATLLKKVSDKYGMVLPFEGQNIKKIKAIPLPGLDYKAISPSQS